MRPQGTFGTPIEIKSYFESNQRSAVGFPMIVRLYVMYRVYRKATVFSSDFLKEHNSFELADIRTGRMSAFYETTLVFRTLYDFSTSSIISLMELIHTSALDFHLERIIRNLYPDYAFVLADDYDFQGQYI